MKTCSYLCIIALLVAAAGPVYAQESRGTILGRVTDQSNAVLPGVTVEATNTATGVTITAITNDEGNYNIPFLNPGAYRVSFSLPGFNKQVIDNVQLRVAEQLTVNTSLKVGIEAQEIVVTADNAVLENATASLGQVVDSRRISELPMREGNPMELVLLAPGIANTTDLRFRKTGMTHSQSQWEADGTGEKRGDFTIDGIPNTSSFGGNQGVTVAFAPPSLSVQEFRVQSMTYDASIGNSPGGVVNVVSKSGTNEYHGEGLYKFRDSALDSLNILEKRDPNFAKKEYSDNLYAGAFGGPVIKDKSFFFVAFEGNVYGVPRSQGARTVPTEKMRNGDFSDLLALGPNYQIYDPATTKPDPTDKSRFIREPLAGNIIPANRISPIAKKMVEYFHKPNRTGEADGRGNFLPPNFVEEQSNYSITGRFDHNFSEKNRIYARASFSWWENIKDDFYFNEAAGFGESRDNRQFGLDHIYVFSPNLLLNSRGGYTWQAFPQGSWFFGFDLGSLGFDPALVALYPKERATFPQVRIGTNPSGSGVTTDFMRASSSVSGLDGTNGIMDYWTAIYSYSSVLSWMKGAHNIKLGPDFRIYDEHNLTEQLAPRLEFGTNYTRGPKDNSPSAPYGQDMAAFMMGYLTGGSTILSPERNERITRLGLFIQDDWKVARKLTLNLGLRYEYETPLTERDNAMVNGFDFTTPLPIEAKAKENYAKNTASSMPPEIQYQVRGGILYAGVGGQPRGLNDRLAKNFMPRLGLAYDVNSSLVVRGGYGIYYDSPSYARLNAEQPGYTRSTPIVPTKDNGQTFIATLANPFPDGLLEPVGNSLGLMTNVGANLTVPFVFGVKAPYAHRFSLTVGYKLPQQFVIEGSYVGSRMVNMPVQHNINAVPAKYLSTLPTRDKATIDYLTGSVKNPLYGIPEVTAGMTGQTVQRSQLLRPYPQFGNITAQESIGKRWYDAAQLRVERRFSSGYTFQASYTYSHMVQATSYLNDTDTQLEKIVDGADRPHIFVASGIYELPFGRTRRFGTGWNAPLDHILGGWQLGVLYRIQSGPPLNLGNWILKEGYTLKDIAKPRSERTVDALFAGRPANASTTNPWFNTDIFVSGSASSGLQLANNIRTMPSRTDYGRRPGYELFDFSLIKKFTITESKELQVRIECYNAFDTVNWKDPSTTVTSDSFGAISATNGYPRQFQLAAVFRF
ncbi:MAG: TonB-dependent receptor domain-containing protein [Acidobacteriota bacterium]